MSMPVMEYLLRFISEYQGISRRNNRFRVRFDLMTIARLRIALKSPSDKKTFLDESKYDLSDMTAPA